MQDRNKGEKQNWSINTSAWLNLYRPTDYRGTYVSLASDPAKDVSVGHDDDVLLGSAAKVLPHPLSTLVERSLVSSVETLLAGPIGRERRKVKALQLGVAFDHLFRRASVAGKVVALLELRQQHNLAQATQPLDGRSVADLGALQRTFQRGREDDLCARLQVMGQRGQSSRLLLTEWRQRRIWDRVVVGDVLQVTSGSKARLSRGSGKRAVCGQIFVVESLTCSACECRVK